MKWKKNTFLLICKVQVICYLSIGCSCRVQGHKPCTMLYSNQTLITIVVITNGSLNYQSSNFLAMIAEVLINGTKRNDFACRRQYSHIFFCINSRKFSWSFPDQTSTYCFVFYLIKLQHAIALKIWYMILQLNEFYILEAKNKAQVLAYAAHKWLNKQSITS